ncbi:MAG: methionine synthase [Planctomycetota bacterium]
MPSATPGSVEGRLRTLLSQRILVIDGAMGTMIQTLGLVDADFHGERFRDHAKPLKGLNDLLCLTRPEAIASIHADFLEAGADLIETNTFNATRIALADYDMQEHVLEINEAAARLAREVADRFTAADPSRPRFVGGSLGPTNRTASISPHMHDPAARNVTFRELAQNYKEQTVGLLQGGVDLLFPETAFDTLNLKACLFGIEEAFEELGQRVPVIASTTIVDRSGRTLTGQTLEACWASLEHAPLFGVGLNCSLGATELRPHVEELARLAPIYTHCYPNAGLPNELGGYDETPEETAAAVGAFAREGLVNLVGGCCGTTPAHIRAIAEAVEGVSPRQVPAIRPVSRFSGLEAYVIRDDQPFTMIGERTNVTGSRRFRRLIKKGDFEAALKVARDQIEAGANLIDVCMDEGLLEGAEVMTRFLNLIASEPDISRVPIMIDSSKWSVIEAGLRCVQGRSIVNSLSLKEGEEPFLVQARLALRYGAAVVIMAFDEQGQAVTTERRLEIFERAHRLLTEEVGFAPEWLIFDPNVLAIATGMPEHDDYARSFIESVAAIKERFPGVRVSGGISNVSFAFRGNHTVREAIHAVFLFHAIAAGLDMGIVNASQITVYDEVEPELLALAEDVVLNRRADATERLIAFAETVSRDREESPEAARAAWRELPLPERLAHALRNGVADHVPEDIVEALAVFESPLKIIEGPLMDGMNIVGDLFGAGKMFLPQVVKSAHVMKKAVAILEPLMDEEDGPRKKGRIVMATVKGDVHDIGKNIVGVVLRCNGYEVIDLGVMVQKERILQAVIDEDADAIGLSGLITPSLDEMVYAAEAFARAGITVPLLIGGATTSPKHTALRIAPAYPSLCVHVKDASRAVGVCRRALAADASDFAATVSAEQARSRERYEEQRRRRELVPLAKARELGCRVSFGAADRATPSEVGAKVLEGDALDLTAIAALIDWTPLFGAWELKGSYPRILKSPTYGQAARELKRDADAMLAQVIAERWLSPHAVYGIFPAHREGDDVVLSRSGGAPVRFAMLRQQVATKRGGVRECASLADFVAPTGDHLGAFIVTCGQGLPERVARYEQDHDDYNAILLKALADRLAEALAEWLHRHVRGLWNHGEDPPLSPEDLIKERYRGIRPAPGYPACPDHTLKLPLFELLEASRQSPVTLTEGLAMSPAASVSGFYFAHPQARYFTLGPIGPDQVADYAERTGRSIEDAERWLRPNLL